MEYTVVEKLGKDVNANDEVWLCNGETIKYEWYKVKGIEVNEFRLNHGNTFLVRVPSSPVMSFEEFCRQQNLLEGTDSAKDKYEGYLVGTRSIVPEMTDEEIENEFEKWFPKQRAYYPGDLIKEEEKKMFMSMAKYFRNKQSK